MICTPYFQISKSLILAFLLWALTIVNVQSQSIYGTCAYSVYAGTQCSYTISAPSGSNILSYSLDGFPQSVSSSTDRTRNTKTYTTTWTSAGNFKLCLRENGGPCLDDITVSVYNPVGPVSLAGPSGSMCPSVKSSTYTASAANATTYYWHLTPSTAGVISSTGVVTWNTSYVGDATVSVNANGPLGGYTSSSVNITREASQTFTASINVPRSICQGEQYTIGVTTSHSDATYKWYEDDSQILIGSTAYLPVTPEVGTTYRVVVRPGSTIPCLANPGPISLWATGSTFSVTPRVDNLVIENSPPSICNTNSATTTVIAEADDADSYDWDLPSAVGQISSSMYSESGQRKSSTTITWNPAFSGVATISATAKGCGGSQTTLSKNIRVTRPPSPMSLANLPDELCLSARVTAILSGSEPNVSYSLSGYGNFTPISPSSWSIGPGIYTVTASDVNNDCSPIVSASQTINTNVPPEPIFVPSSGSIEIQQFRDIWFRACIGSTARLTATGPIHNVNWYQRVNSTPCNCGPCPKYFSLGESQWRSACFSLLNTWGYTSEIAFFLKGSSDIIEVDYIDNVCNESHQRKIELRPIPETNIISMDPSMSVRVQGAETTQFSLEYSGPLYDLSWELTPPEAGTISSKGLVTWNDRWHSFQTAQKVPAVVHAKNKQCTGVWRDNPQFIDVYPILDKDDNRIRTYALKQPAQNYADVLSQIENINQENVKANYFDGLGRNTLNVQYFGATTAKDIIELRRYDEFGREAIKNLPYTGNHTLSYRSEAVNEQVDFYNNPPTKVQGDQSPFSKSVFEPSPWSRIVEQGAPGAEWQPGTNHTVKKNYEVNGDNEVYFFNYEASTNLVSLRPDANFYPAGQLTANRTTDEHGNDIVEYVDKESRTVCKKVQYKIGDNGSKMYASTYYIYNSFGNLVVVLPPEAVKKFRNE